MHHSTPRISGTSGTARNFLLATLFACLLSVMLCQSVQDPFPSDSEAEEA